VKRVVLTSSIAAALYNGKPRTPEVVVDETWFSNSDFLRENKVLYATCPFSIKLFTVPCIYNAMFCQLS
jgi:hypothetical protein